MSLKELKSFLNELETADFKSLKEEIENNFQGYKNLKKLTDRLSHRMTGTVKGRKAEEYVFNKFREYGIEARYDPFKMKMWRRKVVSLSIINSESSEPVDTVSLAYTPILSDVKAEIYDMGDGLEEDFIKAGSAIMGKIVLVNLFFIEPRFDDKNEKIGNPHRSLKAEWAEKNRAKGLIFVNKYYGDVLATGTASKSNDKLNTTPAVTVSIESGNKIRSLLAQGIFTEGHIQVENIVEKVEARNVIGKIRGLELPDERVIIGGHMDTWDLGQGAIDNGLGTFSIVEIARAFKKSYVIPRRTVEFILWMGEEHGLVGSKNFIIKEIKNSTIDTIKYYLNIDMSGNFRGFDIEGRDETSDYYTRLGEMIQKTGIDFLNMQKNKPTMIAYSDDLNFSIQGIPILQGMTGLDSKVYKYYHSNRDNMNLINEEHLRNTSLIMSLTLYKLANEIILPSRVKSIEETEKFFNDHGGSISLVPEYNWNMRLKYSGGVKEAAEHTSN